MKKRHAWPQGHWNWPIKVSHKHGVRCGQMIWVGGQVDLTSDGQCCMPATSRVRRAVIANFGKVLRELDASLGDLVKLLCFYVNDGSVDEMRFLEMVAAACRRRQSPRSRRCRFPISPIRRWWWRSRDMPCWAKTTRLPRSYAPATGLSPLPGRFAQALRCGKMIFVRPVAGGRKGRLLHPGRSSTRRNR